MQGLMLKLLNVDAAGERALRVVAYFDELLVHRPDLESVVRATAILADCIAGLRLPGAPALVFTPDGLKPPSDRESATTADLEIEIDDTGDHHAQAWLERDRGEDDLDDFILERMALVVATVLERRRQSRFADTPLGFADPALAALLVNDRASEADRSRAARLMGITVPGNVQAIALRPDLAQPALADEIRSLLTDRTGRPAYVTQITNELVLCVITGTEPASLSRLELPGRIALGPFVSVDQAPRSWTAARSALRFAGLGTAWPRAVTSDQVGALRLLLALDPQVVRNDPDVQAVEELSRATDGSESIRVLDHVVHADSLRSAAREANFHHSSLQARVKRIESALNMDLRHGTDRQRIAHALLLWQLHSDH